ncbi:unnamed protein product [Linum trigynum]|uniref:Uncharacterized protein n=1 Tax=Linum trigynum TaxID=586398 RepID=A0AAV2FU81_9ROSI
MSSLGAACAVVYVKQKRQQEKLKKMAEESSNVVSNQTVVSIGGDAGVKTATTKPDGAGKGNGGNRVHPAGGATGDV